MAGGFRAYYAKKRIQSIFRNTWGARFFEALLSLYDSIIQALLDSFLAPRLAEDNGPAYDALRPLGIERSIKQWPEEDWLQYRARLRNAWTTWSKAGSFSIIVEQLELAGFPGAFILRTGLTQFDVVFPYGTHSVGPSPEWGSFTWGDGTLYGPTGITPTQLETVRGIIKQWKAHNWVCRRVTWVISGWVYGDPSIDYGDPGLVWGSEIVSVGVY